MRKRFITAGILLFVLFTFAGTFAYVRHKNKLTRAVETELNSRHREERDRAGAGAEMRSAEKKLSSHLSVPLVIEELYRCAKNAGVMKHEVTTLAGGQAPAPVQKPGGEKRHEVARTSQLKITFEGNYRAAAEYVRLMQNINRFKRIVDLEMKSEKDTIKTTITLEILSFGQEHAA